MADAIQTPQDVSPDTQEILNELVAEGAGVLPGTEPAKPEAPVQPEPVKPPEPKEKPPEAKATEPEGQTKTEPTQPIKPVERESRHVPVGKYNETRKEAQALKAELEAERAAKADLAAKLAAASAGKPTEDDFSDIREAATKLAEDNGYEPDFVAKFAETLVPLIGKRSSTKQLEERLANFERQQAEQRQQAEAQQNAQNQDKYFEAEFNEVSKEFPQLASQKEELKELAFSETYKQIPLRFIALEHMHQNPPGRKTVEVPLQGKSDTPTVVDFENLTDEQFHSLTSEQQDRFYAWIDAKNKKR